MRLIDADKLNKKKKYCFGVAGLPFPKSEWFIKASDLFSSTTVDAVPVIHSYWKLEDDEQESDDMYKAIVCAHCGKIGGRNFKYCPNCGSKMDGDKK